MNIKIDEESLRVILEEEISRIRQIDRYDSVSTARCLEDGVTGNPPYKSKELQISNT